MAFFKVNNVSSSIISYKNAKISLQDSSNIRFELKTAKDINELETIVERLKKNQKEAQKNLKTAKIYWLISLAFCKHLFSECFEDDDHPGVELNKFNDEKHQKILEKIMVKISIVPKDYYFYINFSKYYDIFEKAAKEWKMAYIYWEIAEKTYQHTITYKKSISNGKI